MNELNLAERIRLLASEQFSRSGGPGGQNVNKVNTKVTLRIQLHDLGLSEKELHRLTDRLANRVNSSGELIIHSTESRSQSTNRESAFHRAVQLIAEALRPPVHRTPTKPSRSAHRRRLDAKKRQSTRKHYRRAPSRDDE